MRADPEHTAEHARELAPAVAGKAPSSWEALRKDLADELRANLAERYLDDPALSISHIAWLLGFQEASAFTHAFKRWTGETPTQRRRAERTSRGASPGSAIPGAA